MKKLMISAAAGFVLSMISGTAMAQSALAELRLQAGEDAVALSERMTPTPVSEALPESQDAIPAQDVFAQCAEVDALAVRAWTLPEAVQHAQSCLDKTYNRQIHTRKIYWVTAEAARFTVRACPPNAPRTCQGLMLVDGIKISVSGHVPASDTVLGDIGYSLQKRRGFLLGFHAIVANKSLPLP
ncbi:MAG: hypothetical protein ACHQ2Z_04645 [Elusimicrobiota bacterium]